MFQTLGNESKFPFFISASGVAPATPSIGYTQNEALSFGEYQFVIDTENAKNITIRAVTAGLAKFLPKPPKSCFTSMIATALPNTACQIGIVTGRLNAKRTPVMHAEKSFIVFSLFVIFSKPHSKSTHDATQTQVTSAARAPKITIDAMNAGTNAINTSSIIRYVLALLEI